MGKNTIATMLSAALSGMHLNKLPGFLAQCTTTVRSQHAVASAAAHIPFSLNTIADNPGAHHKVTPRKLLPVANQWFHSGQAGRARYRLRKGKDLWPRPQGSEIPFWRRK